MPPGKSSRSKEQTWREEELKSSLKEINDEPRHKDKDRRSRDGEDKRRRDERERKSDVSSDDRERKKDYDRGGGDGRRRREDKDRENRHRDDKDRHRNDRDRDERRHRDDRDKHRSDRDNEDRRHRDDRDKRQDRDGDDRERRHREDKDRERRHRDDKDRERRHDDDRERRHKDDKDREKRRDDDTGRRHRDEKDRERRHRDDKDRERRHDEDRERRHRDDRDRERRGDDDKEKRHRDEKDRERRHRDDKDRERRHEDDRERRHRNDKDRERRHREEREGDKKHRNDRDSERKHRDERDGERRHRDGRDGERRHRDEKDGERRHRDERDRERKHRDDKDRDRTHRDGKDKQDDDRERRHRDEKEIEHREDSEKRTGRDKSEKSSKKEEDFEQEAVVKASKTEGDDDYGDYEEDFEDYDDDFEEDDDVPTGEPANMGSVSQRKTNSEMEELFDALNRENDRLLADSRKSNSNWSDSTEASDEKPAVKTRTSKERPRTFVNFVAAKQRDMNQKVASKARKRCTELLQLIELDTVQFQLFDLPPVKEYDLYMSNFGRTNAQQVHVQTNEDNLERDTQTDEIETREKWSQHPPEDPIGCGGDDDEQRGENSEHRVDEAKLSAFLQRSCQVIERLLEEESSKDTLSQSKTDFSCSDSMINLKVVEIFKSRQVSNCHFSPTQTNMLLTAYAEPTEAIDRKLDKFGLIGLWNIHDPHQPQKILASASIPTCCCFSPLKASFVFAGMRDGSVVAWDLRESPTMHHSFMCGGQDWLLRFPTYNTAGVLQYENHNSPVTSIQPILMDGKKATAQDSGLGLSFQLITIDRNATVNLWVVAEINDTDGSDSDLGLSPNGKVKLLKSSTIQLNNPFKTDVDGTLLCALDMQLNPTNMNHFYVATDNGLVLHGTRFGSQKTVPRAYMSEIDTPCRVTCVDLHPFGQPVLLAGCADGTLRLHNLSTESPVLSWNQFTSGAGIKKALWSRNCPYVMFVLDDKSVIHMWDLLRNDAEPMKSDDPSNIRVADMCLSEERHSKTKPKMALCFEDGSMQVHILSSHVSNLQPGEVDQFQRFIEQL